MGGMMKRAQELKDRAGKRRSERRADSGERALKRKAAQAQRVQHERLDNKYPR